MDRKKFEKATEIMNELKKLHDSVENLECVNKLTFSHTHRGDVREEFGDKSQTFIVCREAARYEAEMRIVQLEKEFNEL